MAANGNLHLSSSWIQKPGKICANSWHQNSLRSHAASCVLPTLAMARGRSSLVSSPAETGPWPHWEVARPCSARAPARQRDNPQPILSCPVLLTGLSSDGKGGNTRATMRRRWPRSKSRECREHLCKSCAIVWKLFCKTNLFFFLQNYSIIWCNTERNRILGQKPEFWHRGNR